MFDGIWLSNDLCAVVALGITIEGEKRILDFQIGASENLEVCTDLLDRIEARGFSSSAVPVGRYGRLQGLA